MILFSKSRLCNHFPRYEEGALLKKPASGTAVDQQPAALGDACANSHNSNHRCCLRGTFVVDWVLNGILLGANADLFHDGGVGNVEYHVANPVAGTVKCAKYSARTLSFPAGFATNATFSG